MILNSFTSVNELKCRELRLLRNTVIIILNFQSFILIPKTPKETSPIRKSINTFYIVPFTFYRTHIFLKKQTLSLESIMLQFWLLLPSIKLNSLTTVLEPCVAGDLGVQMIFAYIFTFEKYLYNLMFLIIFLLLN